MIHPSLVAEFYEKCTELHIKDPYQLVAAMMREFLSECLWTGNKPEILTDSTLIEKNKSMVIEN